MNKRGLRFIYIKLVSDRPVYLNNQNFNSITMEKRLLTDPEIIPDRKELSYAMGDVFPILEKLFETICGPEIGLHHEWRYYNDGKSWLCKVQYKKKTVFWLSVWDAYFKISFYFLEKHLDDLFELSIDQTLKDQLNKANANGKFFPLTLTIKNKTDLDNVFTLINFKKNNL